MRDVAPGEAVVVTARGELFTRQCAEPQEHAPCIFAFVYFARPDSMMDEVSVHTARLRMGVKLGEKILRLRPDQDIDVVIDRKTGGRGRGVAGGFELGGGRENKKK